MLKCSAVFCFLRAAPVWLFVLTALLAGIIASKARSLSVTTTEDDRPKTIKNKKKTQP